MENPDVPEGAAWWPLRCRSDYSQKETRPFSLIFLPLNLLPYTSANSIIFDSIDIRPTIDASLGVGMVGDLRGM